MLSKFNTFDAYFEDTQEARVKIASEGDIKTFCDGLVPDPAFMYLHVIAMGAGDFYGCNKNGDYFPEKSLIMYHHTFEENAKVFKEHNNKYNSPDYGRVVKSWYNPVMHRVELILAVDRAKAPDIVAKVERGEVPEVSMGARVPHDVCSICGNKASKKNEYCDHIRRELKHVYPDGRQVYMLNLQPTFFDISFVFRRADKLGLMLKKVASEEASLDHVYDEVEKTAEIDKQVTADAVVKVLNKGMFNVLPKLEEVEPDLPPALLDRIASKYTLKDILHSFLHTLVPLKPREVTRIIIVQNGMPLESYDDVLRGITMAQRNSESYPGGELQPEISELLHPFMESRSSYGPHVVRRVLMLKHGLLGKHAGLRYEIPDFENKLERFDEHTYNNDLNNYRYDYSSVPVLYNEQQYQVRRNELERRRLREPINPFAVALTLGALYAAYRGVNGLQNLVNTVNSGLNVSHSTKAILGAGALTLTTAAAIHGSGRDKYANFLQSKAVTHFAAPFVGAHLASAHYRNKYLQGEELNGIEKFVAENPDYLSLAAPFVIHVGANKVKSISKAFHSGMKTAADIFSTDDVQANQDEQLKKFADFVDTLSQAALAGIIFKGRGASLAGSVTGATIDNQMYSSIADKVLPKPKIEDANLQTTE